MDRKSNIFSCSPPEGPRYGRHPKENWKKVNYIKSSLQNGLEMEFFPTYFLPGETLREAAIRETHEEAGLLEKDYDLIPNHTVEITYTIQDGRLKSVTYWLAKIRDGADITLSHEHQTWGWYDLEKAIALTNFPTLHRALRGCEAKIKQHLSDI